MFSTPVYCEHCAEEISQHQSAIGCGLCAGCDRGDTMEYREKPMIEILQEFSDNGQKFLLLRENGKEWEEPITGWVMVIDLNLGATVFNHPDGRVASYMPKMPEREFQHD